MTILKFIIYTIFIISLVFIITAARHQPDTEPKSDNFVELSIHNTSWFKISVESKCDYDEKTRKYKYYKIITIPSDSYRIINVPTNLKKCQIYGQLGNWD